MGVPERIWVCRDTGDIVDAIEINISGPCLCDVQYTCTDTIDQLKSQWRPIESAPKDGTRVLFSWGANGVLGDYVDGGREAIGFISSTKGRERMWLDNAGDNEKVWPLFWQPLPAPPD